MRIHWLPFNAVEKSPATPGASERAPSFPQRVSPGALRSLRGKMVLIISIAFALLMLALYYPLRQVLLGNALALESHDMSTNVSRAQDVLATQGDDLLRLALSYATWDDTYQFVAGGAPGYIEANHNPQTLAAEGRDLVYVLDAAGESVAAVTSQRLLDAGLSAPTLSPRIRALLLARVSAEGSYVGFLAGGGGPLLVTAAPILRSDGSGPVVGALAMGYLLDDAALERLAQRTHLDLDLRGVGDSAAPPDMRAAGALLTPGSAPLVRPLDRGQGLVAGYALLADIEGRPLAVLRVLQQRWIYQQGSAGANSLALALVVAWLGFALVTVFLLERLILARIARLSDELRRIGADGGLDDRVTVVGRDELTAMSATVNEMLDALAQASRAQREAAEERLHLQSQVIEAEREAIARVSHELRNPLTPIKGFVDILLHGYVGDVSAAQREVLQTVQENVNRMVGLVNDLLEIGKAESGQLKLQLGLVQLPVAIDRALALLDAEIQRKGLRVERVGEADPPPIEADGRRIDQILINLISNAVKYTYDGGTISVGLERVGPDAVAIRVGDTGVGLTPEQQAKLFTPFFRADSPLHTAANGTGLGLRITRSLVELHGGTIVVTSAHGVGTVFVVTLPATQSRVPAQA